jgi:hypothetical protein
MVLLKAWAQIAINECNASPFNGFQPRRFGKEMGGY